jgi:hypothetical protein
LASLQLSARKQRGVRVMQRLKVRLMPANGWLWGIIKTIS